jgi:hypothetical protein
MPISLVALVEPWWARAAGTLERRRAPLLGFSAAVGGSRSLGEGRFALGPVFSLALSAAPARTDGRTVWAAPRLVDTAGQTLARFGGFEGLAGLRLDFGSPNHKDHTRPVTGGREPTR